VLPTHAVTTTLSTLGANNRECCLCQSLPAGAAVECQAVAVGAGVEMPAFPVWLFQFMLNLLDTPRTPSESDHLVFVGIVAPLGKDGTALQAIIVVEIITATGVRLSTALTWKRSLATPAAIVDVAFERVSLTQSVHGLIGTPRAPRFGNYFLRFWVVTTQAEFVLPVCVDPCHALAPSAANYGPAAVAAVVFVSVGNTTIDEAHCSRLQAPRTPSQRFLLVF